MLPTFLGIGVQRAATTWLHQCLLLHPDIYLPVEKELHFFNGQYHRGLEWYESHFDHAEGAVAVGEITPNYLHFAPLERIARTLPEVQLIVIIREPVERAYSAFHLLKERFSGMSFKEACLSKEGKDLIGESHYAEKLAELYSHFSSD